MKQWAETSLWKAVLSRNPSSEKVSQVTLVLNKAEAVLQSANTSPNNFTLHDADHSYRVAQMMATIIGPSIQTLSEVELSALLLSAYLHDIGMTPSAEVSSPSRSFLLYGPILDRTTPSENENVQNWLDSEYAGLIPPLLSGKHSKPLEEIEEIHAYYCRHRHNDWSGEWITTNVEDIFYPGFSRDLSLLCRSHHFYISELRLDGFTPRYVSTPAQTLNLRYLACVLRVSDVLEFDPERTPSVILEHRQIPRSSRIFWYKDHHLAFKFSDDGRTISIAARSPTAVIHKAILETISQVDAELATCSLLSSENMLVNGILDESDREKYDWRLPTKVLADVKEYDSQFTYIDGAFRPSSKKILSLLSGTALYGTPFAAVRELLQNAFDAVWEQIALEWQHCADQDAYDDVLSAKRSVSLSVELEDDRVWLVCSDSGSGMTKRIIEHYLLVGGANVRPEITALQRHCSEQGLYFGRTGQFGIGMLSYFMISDQLRLETRRSLEGGDEDGTSWKFEVEGLDSFGELRRGAKPTSGTEVRLRIKDLEPADVESWTGLLHKYIQSTLTRVPCRFTFKKINGEKLIDAHTGWLHQIDDLLAESLISRPSSGARGEPITNAERAKAAEQDEQWQGVRAHLTPLAEALERQDRTVGDGFAEVQLGIAGSMIAGNPLCGFMRTDGTTVTPMPNGSLIFVPSIEDRTSWRGFSISARSRQSAVFGYVDIRKDAEVSVSRRSLTTTSKPDRLQDLNRLKSEITTSFVVNNSGSVFRVINELILSAFDDSPVNRNTAVWPFYTGEGIHSLETLEEDFISLFTPKYHSILPTRVDIDGTYVRVANLVYYNQWDGFEMTPHYSGGRVIIVSFSSLSTPAIVWRKGEMIKSSTMPTANFGAVLKDVFCIVSKYGHPVINQIFGGLTELYSAYNRGLNAETLKRAIETKEGAVSFLLSNLHSQARHWTSLFEQEPESFGQLISVCGFTTERPLLIWRRFGSYSEDHMIRIDPEGVKSTSHALTSKELNLCGNSIPVSALEIYQGDGAYTKSLDGDDF